MTTVILAGGLGTRMAEATEAKPKPMVEIGGHPMLWHIMRIYASFGHNQFVVGLGYKGEVIKRYFLEYYLCRNDFKIDLATGRIDVHGENVDDWKVDLIDTGPNTQTGGRIKRLAGQVGDGTFLLTYGDGLTSVDISDVIDFHRSHGRLATVLAVRPPARFGGMSLDDGDTVTEFTEKPQLGEGWINGGFFVLQPEILDYIDGDDTVFEHEPLERLAKDRNLVAYRHDGFWQCMDTMRDVRLLEALWATGNPPWCR